MSNSFRLNSESVLNLFSLDRTVIARTFLAGKLSLKLDQTCFEDIRDIVISELSLNKQLVPIEEKEFYEFICREVLKLSKPPQEELLKLLKEAIDDLNFINKIRERYQTSLGEIKKDKNIEGKKYKLDLVYHYLNKIKNDEEKLIKFLREDLFKSAFSNSISPSWSTFYQYPFRGVKIFYQFENISEIYHKIVFVPITEISYYSGLYNNNKNKFFRIIKKSFPATSLINEIKDTIKSNHILVKKKSILYKFLNFYSKHEWEVFANICPAQIEGMLYKLALEIGIKPDLLKTSSIIDKANFIYKNSELFNDYDYEYFAFVFPVIRNRVSHGQEINKESISDFAYSLLFDLNTVINLFKSFNLNYNKAIVEQKNIEKNESDIHHLLVPFQLIFPKNV